MVRVTNRSRAVAVPRALLMDAVFAEFMATMGATGSEIDAARQAARDDISRRARTTNPLKPTINAKE